MSPNVIEILTSMVAIDSVNSRISGIPRGEQRLANFLVGACRHLGLPARRLPVDSQADNVLVTFEARPDREWLLFECHMDTVGVTGMTIDPFAAGRFGDRISGRGVADAKGAGAAMLTALAEYASQESGQRNVALLFTVDEEIAQAGINAFVKDDLAILGFRPVGAIVGEPTSLRTVVGHKGVVRVVIRTQGIAAHSSDPAAGRSAIKMMLPVLAALENEYVPGIAATHPLLGQAVGAVTMLHGGSEVNTVPANCELHFDRRLIPGEDPRQVIAALDNVIANAGGNAWIDADDVVMHPALDPDENLPFAQDVLKLLAAAGQPSEAVGAGFGTDAGTLAAAGGIASVVLGPGDIAQAHTDDEWLDVNDLHRAVVAYLALMRWDLASG